MKCEAGRGEREKIKTHNKVAAVDKMTGKPRLPFISKYVSWFLRFDWCDELCHLTVLRLNEWPIEFWRVTMKQFTIHARGALSYDKNADCESICENVITFLRGHAGLSRKIHEWARNPVDERTNHAQNESSFCTICVFCWIAVLRIYCMYIAFVILSKRVSIQLSAPRLPLTYWIVNAIYIYIHRVHRSNRAAYEWMSVTKQTQIFVTRNTFSYTEPHTHTHARGRAHR